MTKRIVIYTLMFLTYYSCAMLDRHPGVDSNLKPYYDDFLASAGLQSSRVRVGFRRLPKDNKWIIGECNYLTGNVDIDPIFWHNSSEIERRGLVYHELGHCVLWKIHTKGVYSDGCSKSLMSPSLPESFCLRRYWSQYKEELFKGER